jgi:anti-sigma factor RsiW
MYSCQQVHDQASALIDGELSAGQALALRLHLALCISCRRFVRQLRLLIHSLRFKGAALGPTPDQVEQLLAGIPFDNGSPEKAFDHHLP